MARASVDAVQLDDTGTSGKGTKAALCGKRRHLPFIVFRVGYLLRVRDLARKIGLFGIGSGAVPAKAIPP